MGTPRVVEPLTTNLPSGTACQQQPFTGQWWNERKGGDPKTDPVTEGGDSELSGWHPEETASHLRLVTKKRDSRTSVGGVNAQRERGPETPECEGEVDPRTLASRRHWLLQAVAATAGCLSFPLLVFPSRLCREACSPDSKSHPGIASN